MKKKVNIAVVGLGQIGNYLLNELYKKRNDIEIKTGKKIQVVAISAKNINKKRKYKINKKIFFKNPLEILKKKKIDILFEAVGMADGLSKKIVEESLKKKIHVITPNKALISKHGDFLAQLAEKNNVNLEFEASVAGGIPVLRTLKDGLATNKFNKVVGILNGTCNYILSEMEKSRDAFINVLKKAQKLGYAEQVNPRLDLNGYDALAKVKILSSLAFNKKISKGDYLMEGIENIEIKDIEIAKQLNLKIKLLGITEIINKKLFERVHPCLVGKDTYLGNINGVMNAVILNSKPVGETVLQGEGAGPGPTSSALISDLCSVLKGNIQYPFGVSYLLRKKIAKFDVSKHLCSSYLRIEVKDLPGVLSSVTKTFANNKISIKNLIQNPYKKNKKASIIIITHENLEQNYNNLLLSLSKNKFVLKKPTFIRIEKV